MVEEFGAILANLKPRERVLVLIDACAGLRRPELMAIQWWDIDWEQKQADIRRSIVHNVGKRERVGICKTEVSQKPVPLDDFLLDELTAWRKDTPYKEDKDWVFASPAKDGKWPYWPDTILNRHIRPAARKAGVHKQIGWHTFRHTYAIRRSKPWRKPCWVIWTGGIATPSRSCGPPTRTSFWGRFNAFVNVFLTQDTRKQLKKLSRGVVEVLYQSERGELLIEDFARPAVCRNPPAPRLRSRDDHSARYAFLLPDECRSSQVLRLTTCSRL